MKKEKNFLEKVSSGKGFYIMTVVSFFTIIAAVLGVYYAGARLSDDISKLGEETTYSIFQTKKAETPQTNVSDPRFDETSDDTTKPQEQTAKTTKATTTAATTTKAASSTAVAKLNDSFKLPCSQGILKNYSTSMVFSKTMGDWRTHSGTDFKGDGETQVLSVGNGTVIREIADKTWGYIVEVDYGTFVARYCGLKQGSVVKVESSVKTGDVIGKLDVIPCESEDGLHLHFEALVQGVTTDPMTLLK